MGHKRERDIESLVANMGLEITSFRTEGVNHWRVDVKAPNGRQRPFTFQKNADPGRAANEAATLRRWRREVMPELEAAPVVPVPESMKTTLQQKLEAAGIPLKTDHQPTPAARAVAHLVNPKETLTMTTSHAAPAPQPAPTRKPHVQHKAREQMSFSEVMKFAGWMSEERLQGHFIRTDFLAYASKALGFKVSEAALTSWLDEHNLTMPKRPASSPYQTQRREWHQQMNDDIAAIALALSEAAVPMEHKAAMTEIVERRTKA